MRSPFWTKSLEEITAKLGCGLDGLEEAEAARRLRIYGPNLDVPERVVGIAHLIFRRLLEPMSLVLTIAALASALLSDISSALIIFSILAASITLDTIQEGHAKRAADELRKSVASKAEVKRGGKFVSINAENVVPGDLFLVKSGDIIPADAIVVEAHVLTVNEAALTGEPFSVVKYPRQIATDNVSEASNALFRGGIVQTGKGIGLAVETGSKSVFGQVALSLNEPSTVSPFERDLRELGFLVARATAVLVLCVLAANVAFGHPLIESLMFSVALAIGLTPELLPMITTVTLSRGAIRMARKKVIVKRLSAIHDLGAMTVLCTDKTGTLTSADIELVGTLSLRNDKDERPAQLGAICAILGGDNGSLDKALATARPDAANGWARKGVFPFDYQRRLGAVLADGPEGMTLIVKGAPDAVLAVSTTAGGASLDEASRAQIPKLVQDLAAKGLRSIAIASRPWKGDVRNPVAEDEENLNFEGLCTFADPPKTSAPQAVDRLKSQGIRIAILSGDDPIVVTRLATLVGIPAEQVLTGHDIASLSMEALRVQAQNVNVFARLTPDQKVKVVHALRKSNEIVGFLGDGINDAPGIKAADIGLSVDGATGVACAAADMILLDTDLAVVADGVQEGRQTFANIMKYIRMGASSNFGNMLSMAVAAFFLPFLPMLATQILLNNLLYDISEIGIPFDNVAPIDIAKPQPWRLSDIMRFAAVMGPLSSFFDFVTFGTLYWWFNTNQDIFRTAWFLESIATQTLVIFLIRTKGRPWKDFPNPFLTGTTFFALIVALAIPFLPFGAWFGFVVPPVHILLALILIVTVYMVCAEWLKHYALSKQT